MTTFYIFIKKSYFRGFFPYFSLMSFFSLFCHFYSKIEAFIYEHFSLPLCTTFAAKKKKSSGVPLSKISVLIILFVFSTGSGFLLFFCFRGRHVGDYFLLIKRRMFQDGLKSKLFLDPISKAVSRMLTACNIL